MTTTAIPATTASTTATPATSLAARRTAWALGGLRIVTSFLFLCHGVMAFGLLGGIDGQGTAVPFASWPGGIAGIIEVAGAVLIGLGVGTRTMALLCSGVMAYAYFSVHQPVALLPIQNMGEQAALFCWIFLFIAAAGPGAFALRRR